ncbi:MAG TPA: hypothetical protein PLI05_09775 [Methanotrichaceae archaeon]|nr:hypothetical protein [Methanotrichaceae archaeon]HQI91957.1 hypothetical protein [Methanotrichaceae archaeon]
MSEVIVRGRLQMVNFDLAEKRKQEQIDLIRDKSTRVPIDR